MNITYCKKVKITMIRTISEVSINGTEIQLNFKGQCSFLAVRNSGKRAASILGV